MLVRLRLTTENNQIYKNGVERMTKAIMNKQTITSLELLEQINFFRREEGKPETTHKDLLIIIETEFIDVNRKRIKGGMCPEIHTQIEKQLKKENIEISYYINPQNSQTYKMYILPVTKAKQCLLKESKFVRRAVIHKLEELESEQHKQKILSVPEFLFEQSKLMVEYDKRLNNAENRIEELEKNYNFIEYNKTCLTVSEFAELKHLSNWEYIPRNLGGKATCISKKLNLPIGRIYKHNIKDGKVKGRYFINTYHIKALEQAYAELKQKGIDNVVITCTRPFKEV